MQNFEGTCAAKKVRTIKLTNAQMHKPKVICENEELKNTYKFKYLGSIFAADGDETHDVQRRIAMATSRMGELRHVFNSQIKFSLKMRIYKTAVCSLLTYGSEAWHLDERITAMLNGANARLLSRFTGKDAHAEASARTRTYDLVGAIKERRFKWLGHILRMKGDRLVKLAVKVQFGLKMEGDMFGAIPKHINFNQVVRTAQNRKLWKEISRSEGEWLKKFLPAPTQPRRRLRSMAGATAAPEAHPAPTKPPVKQLINETQAYRNRDVHEVFFRPATKQTMRKRWSKSKPKTQATRGLTDKQRATFAHAHYIIHHGTAKSAAKFMQNKSNTANASAEMLNKLKQM